MFNMVTSAEAAERLGVTSRRVRSLIETARLPARRATPDELAVLLGAGRIGSVPVLGIWVIEEADLELVRCRPVGRPRNIHGGK